MPKPMQQYIDETMALIDTGRWNETIEPESAVMYYGANSSMTSGGYAFLPDFGHLVAWCRYALVPQEFDTENPPLWKYSTGELAQRQANAEAGLDALLADFVREGYKPEMAQRLLDINHDNFHEYEIDSVYVLPDDLAELLDNGNNPLVDWNRDDEDAAKAAAPPFDLSNPEHRALLADRLNDV